MKKYLFKTFDPKKHKILEENVIWGSRPRILVKNIQNNHTYILKSYSKNSRELWVELFATLLWNKIDWIKVQSASITIIPNKILTVLKKQVKKSNQLKPLVVLIQNAFPKWYETTYWFQVLWLSPTDKTSLDYVFYSISKKYKWYWREEIVLQWYTDMLIFDALIWNMDRHLENWGVHEHKQILMQKSKQDIQSTVKFTTLFDHWSAWLYELDDKKIDYYLNNLNRYKEDYIKWKYYSLLTDNSWLNINIFDLLSKVYKDTKWKKYIKKSIDKISCLKYIDIAEVIFKMPEDRDDSWKREKIEYSRNRKELLLKWCILRLDILSEITKQ